MQTSIEQNVCAAVLAGGQSKRFGSSNKLEAHFKGRPILLHVLDTLQCLNLPTVVVLKKKITFLPTHLTTLYDPTGLEGPLGAIYTALSFTKHQRLLVLAGDMPLVSKNIVQRLLMFDPAAKAVAPLVSGRIHPLCAVYHKKLLPIAKTLLQKGEKAAFRLFERAEGKEIPLSYLGEPKKVEIALRGINTKKDLEEICM